ncbi:SegD homing endonuclease [Escherichia phage IME08]|uniref:Homing endonuclease n=2 Tax=Dhakavirus TaxID=1914165 RepID=A0A2S1GRK6_9CAUD|nr:homing endonuclease [Escherichia phage IME08]YP_010094774.1 homing endonuclease [Enterobacteria phage vB_EcoM_IME341]ADI55494.1 SegD homing endonuclease [Escherichia phage IME08]AWD92027.1 homing endonuclease [Enterobacteria phage vB_EcoM_IME341]
MNYLIYKITNLINNKIYVGAHATTDVNDSYMGSGVNIVKSIKKYGLENFKKEILFNFETSEEMYAKEAELVDEAFVMRTDTYNAALGGKGNPVIVALQEPGYREMLSEKTKAGMTKEVRAKMSKSKTGSKESKEHRENKSIANKKFYENRDSHLKGRKLSEEHKAKIRENSNKGKKFVFVDIMIKGYRFDRYETAAEFFNVTGATIRNWIKETRPQFDDCYKL